MNRIPAIVVWVVLVGVVAGLAPPMRTDALGWVLDLLTVRWTTHGSWVVAAFWVMGLWPLLVGLLIRPDWRGSVPAWPFVLASFALGCYALLPWFFLRREPRRVAEDGWFARWDVPVLVVFATVACVAWAGVTGDPADLSGAVTRNGLAFAMAADFLAFYLLSVVEARARTTGTPWAITLIPLLGLGIFLAFEARRCRARWEGCQFPSHVA